MKRKLPVVECDLCEQQQVDNGDVTEILGLTIKASFYAGHAGDGSLPKDLFICDGCVQGSGCHPYRKDTPWAPCSTVSSSPSSSSAP